MSALDATTSHMWEFAVIGEAAPQGSKTAVRAGNRARVIEGGSKSGRIKHAMWRDSVAAAAAFVARREPSPVAPEHAAYTVVIEFLIRRPPSTPRLRIRPSVKPDGDKLARAVLDALVDGGLLVDDARVTSLLVVKTYATAGEASGARIRVLVTDTHR